MLVVFHFREAPAVAFFSQLQKVVPQEVPEFLVDSGPFSGQVTNPGAGGMGLQMKRVVSAFGRPLGTTARAAWRLFKQEENQRLQAHLRCLGALLWL